MPQREAATYPTPSHPQANLTTAVTPGAFQAERRAAGAGGGDDRFPDAPQLGPHQYPLLLHVPLARPRAHVRVHVPQPCVQPVGRDGVRHVRASAPGAGGGARGGQRLQVRVRVRVRDWLRLRLRYRLGLELQSTLHAL